MEEPLTIPGAISGSRNFYHDGYRFVISRTTDECFRLKCGDFRTRKCKATAKFNRETQELTLLNTAHTHARNYNLVGVARLRQELKDQAATGNFTSLSKMYHHVCDSVEVV
jgi:hypothetical protein